MTPLMLVVEHNMASLSVVIQRHGATIALVRRKLVQSTDKNMSMGRDLVASQMDISSTSLSIGASYQVQLLLSDTFSKLSMLMLMAILEPLPLQQQIVLILDDWSIDW